VRHTVGEALDEVLWGPHGYRARTAALLEAGNTPYDVAAIIRDEVLEAGAPDAPAEDEEA